MAEKPEMLSLFEQDEIPHLIKQEWKDMPEFTTQDLTPYKQLIISFRNPADYKAFGELIGQRLTPKTKSVWHPKVEIERYMDKRWTYVDPNDEQSTDAPSE